MWLVAPADCLLISFACPRFPMNSSMSTDISELLSDSGALESNVITVKVLLNWPEFTSHRFKWNQCNFGAPSSVFVASGSQFCGYFSRGTGQKTAGRGRIASNEKTR